jgi:small subunit ribosomal protein S20
MRQTRARTTQNRAHRSQLRTAIKKVRAATDPKVRAAALAEAIQLIDRAGRKRVIHPNAAARHKSRLSALE